MKISPNSTVTLHFDLRLKDGSIAESTKDFKPMQFQMGMGVFSEKFEAKLLGLQAGDKSKIMLMPEDAFGEPHPANIFQVPADKFKGMDKVEVGSIFLFTQPSGQEIPGIIRAIENNEITVDFNHPLAGQVVLFDIEIIKVD
jgi:FKBP-type peptidyl-prolyl cis-trans isomerase SlpA